MKNDIDRSGNGGSFVPRHTRGSNGANLNSFKAFSSYFRYVSAGASTVASTVRSAASAASAIVGRDAETNHDQVSWAGFDKLELERGITRQVLLLGYSYGFQVWDVESADNVRNLVSRHDGPVSFLQMLPKPVVSKQVVDKFAASRPLLILCADGSFSGGDNVQEGLGIPCNGSNKQCHGSPNGSCMPTVVWFYSMRLQSHVHLLRFRSVVHLVRCSSQIVAVLQSNQIHCFDAATLERQYTILTNPVVMGCYGSVNIGFGPLAVGPRWMAYSGSQVARSNYGRVSPQNLTSSASFPCPASNGSLVAHYAKESSKQLAAGIVTLGDMGYKKLSRYYSELLPEGNNFQPGTAHMKAHGIANVRSPDEDNVGMVIVRDTVSKTVIAQFRAHKSPILLLCFDPSGTLLVTASVQGHNINVFRIMPGGSGAPSVPSYVHLFRLQRGLTNAVIQDISFSSDSQWIMISSSRGTSHLFAVSPFGGIVNFQSNDPFVSSGNNGLSSITKLGVRGSPNSGLHFLTQQSVCASGPPVTLSAISRIRNGNNGWRNTVSGAAAAATGRINSLSGTIASVFHNCKGNNVDANSSSREKSYYLLVFSPSGCVTQYALRISPAFNGMTALPGLPGLSASSESGLDCDARLVVEATQKWNICQKQNRRERSDNTDMYGETVNTDNSKVYPERMELETNLVYNLPGKENVTTEEKHHMYISEVELSMHQNQNPLWARSEIYFQTMLTNGSGFHVEEGVIGGEIEIERVSTRMLETRSKKLVPVFDYVQAPKFKEQRVSFVNIKNNGQFQGQEYEVFENEKVARKNSSGSLDSINSGCIITNEWDNGNNDDKGEFSLGLSAETSRGFVNTADDTPIVSTGLENVNTTENYVMESQLRSVHNRYGLAMENQFTSGEELD